MCRGGGRRGEAAQTGGGRTRAAKFERLSGLGLWLILGSDVATRRALVPAMADAKEHPALVGEAMRREVRTAKRLAEAAAQAVSGYQTPKATRDTPRTCVRCPLMRRHGAQPEVPGSNPWRPSSGRRQRHRAATRRRPRVRQPVRVSVHGAPFLGARRLASSAGARGLGFGLMQAEPS